MIRGFVFDFDGVIVDTSKYHFQSWCRLGEELGFEMETSDDDHLKGAGRMESLDYILSKHGIKKTLAEKQELADRKNGWYKNFVSEMKLTDTLPGVMPFLIEAREKGYKLAVGSGSKNALRIIKQMNLTSYFDGIRDGNDTTFSKPHPEIFLKSCASIDVAPYEAIVFEDASKGVDAARAAGCQVVGIGDPDYLQLADIVVSGFDQINLDELVQKLFKDSIV